MLLVLVLMVILWVVLWVRLLLMVLLLKLLLVLLRQLLLLQHTIDPSGGKGPVPKQISARTRPGIGKGRMRVTHQSHGVADAGSIPVER